MARKPKAVAAGGSSVPCGWNVITSPWVEVMDHNARLRTLSVIDVLSDAAELHRIVEPSPLDLFAIHRFLLTLLYWQAETVGGVQHLRASLLKGAVPKEVIDRLRSESARFNLFDAAQPFLQDSTAQEAKRLPASSLFAEMASGTNVAHFHHGDDAHSTLCLRCATLGLLRLVPWTQSGGSGKKPAIHGAPPILPIAIGRSICETLGLNLVPVDRPVGVAQWTGQFRPTAKGSRVALLEGLTWNARRVHLLQAEPAGACNRCGVASPDTVGPIVFEKNEACKDSDREWRDPAAFYRADDPRTVKTNREAEAAVGDDLRRMFVQTFGKKTEPAPISDVVAANPTHTNWLVVMPCTNPANNKSYDHRLEAIEDFTATAPRRNATWAARIPWQAGDDRLLHSFCAPTPTKAMHRFVAAAARLDGTAWAVLASACNRGMDDNPAAFDVFTGLYWPLRSGEGSAPPRAAAWMALKLMATAGRSRPSLAKYKGTFQPWCHLVTTSTPAKQKRYRRAVPSGQRLEMELREIINKAVTKSPSTTIDWPGLCQFLSDVTP